MSTISVSRAHCGAESKSICPNRSRSAGQAVHGLTIGAVINGLWYSVANGKQSIEIGWRFQQCPCMNGSKRGNSRVSGTRCCVLMVRFYNRMLDLWQWQLIDSKSVPAPLGGEATGHNPTDILNAGQRFISWLTSAASSYFFDLNCANQHDKWSVDDLVFSICGPSPYERTASLFGQRL